MQSMRTMTHLERASEAEGTAPFPSGATVTGVKLSRAISLVSTGGIGWWERTKVDQVQRSATTCCRFGARIQFESFAWLACQIGRRRRCQTSTGVNPKAAELIPSANNLADIPLQIESIVSDANQFDAQPRATLHYAARALSSLLPFCAECSL